MNANGLYNGLEGYIVPGTNSGMGNGVANGAFGDPDNVISIVRDSLRIHLDPLQYTPGSSTWTDLTGNGFNATLVGSPEYNPTMGGSFTCNRTSTAQGQYITIPNPTTTGNHSVCIWIKFNGTFSNASEVMVYGGGGVFSFRIFESTSGTILPIIVGNSAIFINLPTTPFFVNKWFNFTLVRDGLASNNNGINYVYLDGNLIFSQVGAGSAAGNSTIGLNAASNGISPSLNNTYGMFLWYTRPLTPAEVTQNYNALKSRYTL
jgi:hypothetical protein